MGKNGAGDNGARRMSLWANKERNFQNSQRNGRTWWHQGWSIDGGYNLLGYSDLKHFARHDLDYFDARQLWLFHLRSWMGRRGKGKIQMCLGGVCNKNETCGKDVSKNKRMYFTFYLLLPIAKSYLTAYLSMPIVCIGFLLYRSFADVTKTATNICNFGFNLTHHTHFSKRSAHENQPNFLRSLGHRPRPRVILILSIRLESNSQKTPCQNCQDHLTKSTWP